jgi:hypothetical protein
MQSILVKLMKNFVVRGCMLQLLYERRSEGSIPFGHMEQAVPPRRREAVRFACGWKVDCFRGTRIGLLSPSFTR